MIQAADLRTGNCLHYKDKGDTYPILNRVDWEDIKWLAQNSKSFNECHKPIHLSPEVLEQWCGFEVRDGYYSNGSLGFDVVPKKMGGFMYMVPNPVYALELKWLHQLQNLYYALCGTELEVKLPSPLHETENK